jgi:hypothetical protein
MVTDLIAEAGEGLVDRVVDDFVHQVMEAGGPGGPDVHGRPLADRLESFENLDLVGPVIDAVGAVARPGRRPDGFGLVVHTRIGMITYV